MELIEEILNYCVNNGSGKTNREICKHAMNLYAKQKMDEAVREVGLLETKEYTTPDIDKGFAQGIESAIETIIKIKEGI